MSEDANVRQAVPFFLVSDMEASVRYYVDGLGFAITKRWIDDGKLRWCWLELGRAEIMLQERHESSKPGGKVGEGVRRTGPLPRLHQPWHPGLAPLRRQRHVGHLPVRSGRLPARLREPHGCAGGNAARRVMPVIHLYSGQTHVGDMSIEHVDEGMGVGTGSFRPSANYREIREQIVAAANARNQRRPAKGPPLVARAASGETIVTGFIQIDDFADVDVDPEIAIQFPDREQLERIRTAG